MLIVYILCIIFIPTLCVAVSYWYEEKYFKTRIKKVTKTLADGTIKESYIAQVDMLFFWGSLEDYSFSYDCHIAATEGKERYTLDGEKDYIDFVIKCNKDYQNSRVVDKKIEYIKYP